MAVSTPLRASCARPVGAAAAIRGVGGADTFCRSPIMPGDCPALASLLGRALKFGTAGFVLGAGGLVLLLGGLVAVAADAGRAGVEG